MDVSLMVWVGTCAVILGLFVFDFFAHVRVPHDPSSSHWNFNGQTIDIPAKATTTVKDLKGMLKEKLGGMPTNKMQLKHPSSGFMNKDGLSLAFFNVGPMATIDLVPKTRGGRK